jgi:hypothetical protein
MAANGVRHALNPVRGHEAAPTAKSFASVTLRFRYRLKSNHALPVSAFRKATISATCASLRSL